jgi:hypothetical protein
MIMRNNGQLGTSGDSHVHTTNDFGDCRLEKVLYTARVHTTGGRAGVSRSSDGRLEVRVLNRDLAESGIYAGLVAIAGLVIPIGQEGAGNSADFPDAVPRIRAADIANLHWALHTDRSRVEATIGDAESLYAIPRFF